MNISSILYDLSGVKIPVSVLSEKMGISSSEAAIFEKIFGLQFVIRDEVITHELQLVKILSVFFKKNKIDRAKIKYCIYAHTADDVEPIGFSALENIIRVFGLYSSQYFGVSLHKCASAFQVFKLCSQLFFDLKSDDIILIIISDIAFTEVLRYIPGSTFLSDSVILLELKKSDSRCFFVDVLLNENGIYSKGVFCDKEEQLFFQGDYVNSVVNVIQDLLFKNKISLSQVKKIFPHNVNAFSWKKIAEKLNIHVDKIYCKNISKIAHCFGADPFINLLDAESEGILISGDYIVLVTVGLGATFAAMLLTY